MALVVAATANSGPVFAPAHADGNNNPGQNDTTSQPGDQPG